MKDFIANKHKDGLSPATIRIFKAFLSCILSEAVNDEIITSNPVFRSGKLIPKTEAKKEINPLSWKEKALFEKTAKGYYPRWYPFFLTALRTGLRLGELTALQPADLDFNGGLIEVRRNYTKGRISTTKSGKIRRVDMSKELSETLKTYLVELKKETLKKGGLKFLNGFSTTMRNE